MGTGIFNKATGKFDLVLSIRYDAIAQNEMADWEEAFQQASDLLFEATDGQHQLGTIYVYNNDDPNTRDIADAYILSYANPTGGESFAPGYGLLGESSQYISFFRDEKDRPFVILHEFAHYVYGLYDEYIRGGPNDPACEDVNAHCLHKSATQKSCIMEASWQDDARKFCSQKSPPEAIPSADYHTYDNLQEHAHHLPLNPNPNTRASCWDTMFTASRYPHSSSDTFDLTLPSAAANFLPAGNINTTAAEPINWIVLGQQQRFMLVVDRSDNMTGSKLDNTRAGLRFWADAAFAASTNDRIGLLTYASSVSNPVPFALQSIDATNIDTLRTTIGNIVAGGMTATGDALRAALSHILGNITSNQDKGQNVIVLLTSGTHDAGNETPEHVLPDLISNGVQLYIIGIGADVNATFLKDMADRTGGQYYPIDLQAATSAQQAQIKDTLIKIEGMAHGRGLVADITGSTNPGIREESVYIEQGSNKATFTLSWDNPNDLLALELLSPDNKLITLKEPLPSNVRAIYSQDTYMGFQVEQPMSGNWHLIVQPEKVTEIAHFRLVAFSQNPRLSGGLIELSRPCQPGMAMLLQFRCYFDLPLTKLNISSSILLPDGNSIPVEFSDGGNNELGDVLPSDGLYSTIFRDTSQLGMYTIKMIVDNDGDTATYGKIGVSPWGTGEHKPNIPAFHREFTRTVGVGELPRTTVKIEPKSSYPGTRLALTLKGENTHFQKGSTTISFGDGIKVGNTEIIDRHTILVSIDIDKKATVGSRTLTVTRGRHEEKLEIAGGFQVVRHERVWSDKWIITLLVFLVILLTILLLIMTFLLMRGR